MTAIPTLGVPKSGRLRECLTATLSRLECTPLDRGRYILETPDFTVKFLKTQDIALLVGMGVLSAGFVVDEWALEDAVPLTRISRIPGYLVSLSVIVERGADLTSIRQAVSATDAPLLVVADYPRVAAQYAERTFGDLPNGYSLIPVRGGCEALVPSPAAIAIGCVETGRTLRRNGLVEIEVLAQCHAHLAHSPNLQMTPAVEHMLRLVSLALAAEPAGASSCDPRGLPSKSPVA